MSNNMSQETPEYKETVKFTVFKDGTVVDSSNGKVLYKTSSSVEPQQEARLMLHEVIEEHKMSIIEEWEMDDDSIEVSVLSPYDNTSERHGDGHADGEDFDVEYVDMSNR